MTIPHYAYLVLKMPWPHAIISVRGNDKRAFDYNWESCETADILLASIELQELKHALAESHPDLIMPQAKTSKTFIQPDDTRQNNPIVHGGTFQGGSRGQQFGSQIGTRTHQIPPGK
jgi:hypothetical protein